MWIMVAGPISAPDECVRDANLSRLTQEALWVRTLGHVPIVAHFLAAPLRALEAESDPEGAQSRYLSTCTNLADRCDAIYIYASSPGADLERAAFEQSGRPVYRKREEIPPATSH